MKNLLASLTVAAGLIASAFAFAQAPAGAPAGSTGQCKDGTYTTNPTKKGACAGHKGVKDWYGGSAAAEGAKTAAPAKSKAATPEPTAAPAKKGVSPYAPSPRSAAGGAGQVWVNTDSKVYHCPGSRYYGKTKQGQYMSEAAAKAAGNRPDHGKSCTGK